MAEEKVPHNRSRPADERHGAYGVCLPLPYQSLGPDGTLLDVNQNWLDRLGHVREEVIGHWFGEFLGEEFRDLFRERFEWFKSVGSVKNFDFRMVHKDGTSILALFNGVAEYDDEGNFVRTHCLINDVTELRAIQEAYQSLVDNSLQGLVILTSKSVLFANEATARMCGHSVEDLRSFSAEDMRRVIHPDDREKTWATLTQRLAGKGMPPRVEFRLVRKDGSVGYVAARASHVVFRGEPAIQVAYEDLSDREAAEAALQASETRLRAILDASPDYVLVLDRDLKIQFANRAAPGLTLDQVLGSYLLDLADEAGRAEAERVLRRAIDEGASGSYEASYPTPDGGEILFGSRAEPMRDPQTGETTAVVLTARDITSRKIAEQALRVSEAEYQDLYDNAPNAYFSVDVDGIIRRCNQWACELLGHSEEELVGSPVLRHYARTPQGRDAAGLVLKRFKNGEPVRDEELQMQRSDGSSVWVSLSVNNVLDEQGAVVESRSVVVDIDARKEAEAVLVAERNNAQRYLDIAGVMFVAIDKEGVVTLVNQRGCEILGREESDIIGMSWFDTFIPKRLRDRVRGVFEQLMIEATEPVEFFENVVLAADGQERLVTWHNTVLRDAAGRPVGTLSSGEDITERKQAEEALESSEERYRLLFENMMDGFALHEIILDEQGTPADYTFLEVNAAFEQLTGLRREDLLGRRVTKALPGIEEDPGDWIGRYGDVALTGKEARFELHAEPLGKWFSVLAFRPREGQFATIFEDVTERKRVEEALRDSEQKYSTITESSADAIFVTDQTGHYTYANKAACALLGYSAEELLSMSIADVAPEGQANADLALFGQLVEAGRMYAELELLRKDGSIVPVDLNAVVLPNGLIYGSCRDLTERKRIEQRFQMAAEVATDLIYEWDAVTDDLHWFGDIDQALGFEPGEIAHDVPSWIALIHPDDQPDLEAAVEFHRTHTGLIREEYRIHTKDGSLRHWIDQAAPVLDRNEKPVRWIGVCIDVTERMSAREAMRASEEKLRQTFATIGEGITVTDLGGVILQTNRAALRIFGYDSSEEILGKSMLEYVGEADRPLGFTTMQETVESGASGDREFQLIRKDGSTFPGEISGTLMRDESGAPVGFVVTSRDITDRKRAEEELLRSAERLRDLRTQLDQAEEEERRRIARELHDQVSQNLTALSINVQGAATALPESAEESSRKLDESGRLIEETMEHIRNLTFDLRPPVLDDFGLLAALKWHAERAASQSDLNVGVEGKDSKPRLSPSLEIALFRIAQEALTNVAKHAQGTRVTIRLTSKRKLVTLVIEDDGVGFDVGSIQQDEAKPSWGLLNMRERAEAVGGTFLVQSSHAEGTRIVVEVPR